MSPAAPSKAEQARAMRDVVCAARALVGEMGRHPDCPVRYMNAEREHLVAALDKMDRIKR